MCHSAERTALMISTEQNHDVESKECIETSQAEQMVHRLLESSLQGAIAWKIQ